MKLRWEAVKKIQGVKPPVFLAKSLDLASIIAKA